MLSNVLPVSPSTSLPSMSIRTSPMSVPLYLLSVRSDDRVLLRQHDRRGVLPVDAVLGQADRVLVVVHPRPVGVVQLVQREAGVQGVVEAHVVDCLVDRFL